MMDGISVVIPCYNAAQYLPHAIASVLNQDYAGPIEILVGDDASLDGSRRLAESFGEPVRVLPDPKGKNRGGSAARNRCIKAATFPFIAFLDADDYWLPGHLSSLFRELHADSSLALVYDNGYDVNSKGEIICSRFPEPRPRRLLPDDLLLDNCFGTGNVIVRRHVFDKVGYFDETLRHAEDHDMWLRIVEVFPAAHAPSYGFCYRFHTQQISLSPALWAGAEQVLKNACLRYPYRFSTIRRRKAVLAFRFSQIAFAQSRPVAGLALLAKAAVLDPPRAVHEGWCRFKRRFPLFGVYPRHPHLPRHNQHARQ